jgi:hypothetical protein
MVDDDDVVKVVDVDDDTVTYRLVEVGGSAVTGEHKRTQARQDFDFIFDECGAPATSSIAGP